jgi:hypothetical protein
MSTKFMDFLAISWFLRTFICLVLHGVYFGVVHKNFTRWNCDRQLTFGAGPETTLSSQTEVRELFRMAHRRGRYPELMGNINKINLRKYTLVSSIFPLPILPNRWKILIMRQCGYLTMLPPSHKIIPLGDASILIIKGGLLLWK